ncbi:HAMP domain-containing sensor histidine kinase [Clostridium sp. E02]|uniref:sensor histidine kinase n=1 Tax=Clostridium sp. E02 TaxID=2487134 RepID=UPI000F53B066|nr:HAMP domain-containing sensor histidine kinase [Clostridium sp. E02]
MTHSLYYKFIMGYLLFGLLGFFTIATFSSKITDMYLLRENSESLYGEANQIASSYSSMYHGKEMNLSSSYPELVKEAQYLHSQIWIVDRQGKIVSDSQQPGKVGDLIANFDPTIMGNKSYAIGDYYHEFPYDVLSVHAPITGNYTTYGYVVIHLPLSYLRAEREGILNIIYLTAGVVFALSLIILLVFTKNVYFPLKKITAGANEYAQGNLNHHISVNTQDEMGYLAATLNYMSDELNKMEEYQKTFIANISHDFRSPLTSIKGYLEAILDGTISSDMSDKYLKRVISETERLNKLTQGMLTLNSLDCKGYLNRTNFDINRVIKDTAASFEGTCSEKGITFEVTFSDTIQMVYADLGKIQQVLYNIIDNAIKFSPEDSTIYIQASLKYEKIFVSIKDTGIGIPKDSLKKIWERFYKTDLSRGKDKKGTGLGLAIVREIIQSHGENIDVISTEEVGTEFIFSLPKSNSL